MDDFSWADGLRAALRPCLSCFASREEDGVSDSNDGPRTGNPRTGRSHSARHNDLEGLLRDPEDTDVDAETWSLHSNVGIEARKKKRNGKRRSKKSGSSFLSYFGRSNQAIRLPESDSEDDDGHGSRRRQLHPNSLARSNSSSTSISSTAFDSDAASLDPTAIAKLSAQEALARAEAAAREAELRAEVERRLEEERQEKAERRRSRMERRELRRASQLIALGVEDVPPGAFDYQQQGYYSPSKISSSGYFAAGSVHPGAGYAAIPADFTQPRVRIAAGNNNHLNIPSPLVGVIEEDDGGDAHTDFGGEVYTIKTRKSKSNLRSMHGGNSDTGSSRSSRSHAHSVATSNTSSSSSADPTAIAYQRFLAMAALNGGPAALAALPSPGTPALSLSSPSVSPMSSGFDSGMGRPSLVVNEDVVPSLADPPKRAKKRRPETWIAPSSSSPYTLAFDPQSITAPLATHLPGMGMDPNLDRFQSPNVQISVAHDSTLGLEVNPNIHFQGGLAGGKRKKRNRMSMSGAL